MPNNLHRSFFHVLRLTVIPLSMYCTLCPTPNFVLYSTFLFLNVLYCSIPYFFTHYCTIIFCTLQQYTMLSILYRTGRLCTVLKRTLFKFSEMRTASNTGVIPRGCGGVRRAGRSKAALAPPPSSPTQWRSTRTSRGRTGSSP
jgi:hypothetical protein